MFFMNHACLFVRIDLYIFIFPHFAGIIAEKDYNQQYTEMLAIALARDDVELSPEVAGPYLFNAGYMAKSKYARLGEIVQRAKDIRGKR